jgi:hypothetical protein
VAGPDTYPTTGRTFYVTMLDGSYTRALGETSATFVVRQSEDYPIVFNLRNELPPVGTELAVFEWNGYWWADWCP